MAFGANRSVKVNLQASVSDYIGKMTAASKATRDFSKDAIKHAEKHKESWTKVGTGMAVSGAAIAVGIGAAVKAYADFDAQMSQVRAVSNASAGDMAKLTAAAREAGKGTSFSATEAAQATTELAKVGLSTSEILGGALTGSLSLAAAGNIDLARAAEISGQTMKIFKLEGKDVGVIADALANGANKSAADVETLAQALQQGGLVAAQTGLTMENTVGVLSLFADNALQGSDAGTSLKTMLMRLTPQTDAAAAAMEQVGLKAYDAQGNFIGIEAVAGQLREGLSGLSQEQRNATLQTIFGSDAIRAASILYSEGADGVREYDLAVRESGAAARVAAINQDNLRGDIEKLKGAFDDLLISMGEGADSPLRSLVQKAQGIVDAFNDLPQPMKTATLWTAAVGSAALITGGSLLVLIPRIAATKAAMLELGTTGPRAAGALKGLAAAAGGAAALGAVAYGLVQIHNAGQRAVPGIEATTAALLRMDKAADVKAIDQLFASIDTGTEGFKDLEGAFRRITDKSWREGFNDAVGGIFGETNEATKAADAFDNVSQSLARMVESGQANEAGRQFDLMAKSLGLQGEEVGELLALMPAYSEAVQGAQNKTASASSATQGMSENLDTVAQSAEDTKAALDDYIGGLQDAGLVVLNSRQAQRDLKTAIAEVGKQLEDNGRTLNENTEKGRANAEFLDGLAQKHLKAADAIFKETGSEAKYRESLLKSRASLIQTAQKFGMSRTAAEKYADSILNIPPKASTTVSVAGIPAANKAVEDLKLRLRGLDGKTVTTTVRVVNKEVGTAGGSTRGGITKADGGYIAGPGTATSDSIPAYLSNGEYVIKAAAVDKYGKSFFDTVNAMRFASGGLVSQARQPAQVASGGPVSNQTTFNAYGNDSEQALRRAMREWEYRQVPR